MPGTRFAAASLTARALWWRRGASATLLAVAVVTTAASALGPLYARAASESTFNDRLSTSPPTQTLLNFTTSTDVTPVSAVEDVRAKTPAPGSVLGYPTSVAAIRIPTEASVPGVPLSDVSTQLAWREDQCAHLTIVSGRCVQDPDDVIISDRTVAGGYGWKLGSQIEASAATVDITGEDGTLQEPILLKVVGVYRPTDADEAYWGSGHYFNAHLYAGRRDGPDTVDAVFTDIGLFPKLSAGTTGEVSINYPIDPTQVHLGDTETLQQQIADLQGQFGAQSAIKLQTNIVSVLEAGIADRNLLSVSTLLVALQLALLAWLVLFQVVSDSAEVRGNEIALAKLRGLSAGATVRFGLSEPLMLLALAVPLGLLLAWLVVKVVAVHVLAPGTPVAMTLGGLLGALVGFLGGAVAAAFAARRVLTRPVLEQWRGVPQDRPPTLVGLIIDFVLAACAVLGLVVLNRDASTADQPRAISLLAPALLVLAVALLGVRLLPYLCRAWLAPTRASRRIGAFLAVRQVVRRPAGLRLAALLAVALGLATFAVDGEAVASTNRATRAAVEVGASQVVVAQYQVGHDPVTIARSVDPAGAWAMGAATWIPYGGAVTGTMVAVDSSRLAAVANWPPDQISASEAAQLIGPQMQPPITIRTGAVRVRITQLAVTSGQPPIITLRVQPPGRRLVEVDTVALRPGTNDYEAAVPCTAGCTFTGIELNRPIDEFDPMAGSVRYERIEQQVAGSWVAVPSALTTKGAWRADGPPDTSKDRLTATPAGTVDVYTATSGSSPAVRHVDSPTPIPVLATPEGLVRAPAAGPPVVTDATGASAAIVEAATVPLLPVAVDNGVLADVSFLQSQVPDFSNEASWQVWLGAAAPPDAVQRLKAAGLLVQSVHTQAHREQLLARQGPALALLLLVACAVAGSILAAGATALALAVSGRRRSFELAALRAVGVRRASLLRSSIGEQLILLGTGLLLGVPAGIVAARLTLAAIPEYSDVTPIPLDLTPNVPVLAAFVVAVAVLLVVVAVVAGRLLMRAAVPARLREAAE